MFSMFRKMICLVSFVLVPALMAVCVQANSVISVNCAEGSKDDPLANQTVLSEEIAGYGSYATNNWNNVQMDATGTELWDNSGTLTGAFMNFQASNGWGDGSVDTSTSDGKIARGYFDDGETSSGIGVDIEVTNIPYELYDVVLYMASDGGIGFAEYTVNGVSKTPNPVADGSVWQWTDWVLDEYVLIFENVTGARLDIEAASRGADGNALTRGTLAGFQIARIALPTKSQDPHPADGATDVPRDVVLSWTPGDFAAPTNGHKVYFGESFDDVNDATGGITQDANSYTPPQRLDFGTTYYWRVDEVNAPPTSHIEFKGEVWQFTTEPFAYAIENITATASSQSENQGPENTINGLGLDVNDLHSIEAADMWLSSDEPNGAWIEFELDKVCKLHQMWVWNHNTLYELAIGYGVKEATIEYSLDGADWTTLGTTHEFARGSGAAGYAYNTTVDFGGVAVKYVRLTISSNWGGLLPKYGLSEVRFLYIPVFAREPNPASGATDMGVDNVTLSWRAGREATSHDVYLSTDEQAVIDEAISPVSVPADSSYASYDTGALDLVQSYYWKINEVNDAETTTTWQGDIWNFTTLEYLVVDDFELYNDIADGEEGSNLVYLTWIDGYENPSVNGSTMGHTVVFEPSMESVTVYDGEQSAPLYYDNTTASISEVTVDIDDLAIGRDWTKHGIKALTLWFFGDPNNAPQQMYVKVGSAKVLYDGDITRPMWRQWNIDLASFGVDLSNVTEISIGFDRIGAVGGQGMVFFDEIRLYESAPAVASEEIWLEAEAGTLGASWRTYDDPASSAGRHIGSSEDDGDDNATAPGAEWVATYNFDVAGGDYRILLRGQQADSDSFWVRIPTATSQTLEDPDQPGSGWVRFNGMDIPSGAWGWDDVHSNDHDDETVIWTLPAGPNTLEIAKREDGTLLDAIVITDLLD